MSDTTVLIHGFATSALRTWHETGWVDLLEDAGRTVLAIDLPGHGAAEKSHDPQDYDDLAERVLAQFPDGAVDLVGFSQGARTSLEIAIDHPDRIDRLVVAGVGKNLFEESTMAEDLASILDGSKPATTPITRHFVQLANAGDQDPLALAAFLRRAPWGAMDAAALAKVTAPTLVVLGTEDFAGPADPLVAALSGATLCELRGVDHFATPKSFDFISAALEFLGA